MVGRKASKSAKLEEIYALASESIGLPVDSDSAAIETYRLQLARYLDLNQQRAQLEARARPLLPDNPVFQL